MGTDGTWWKKKSEIWRITEISGLSKKKMFGKSTDKKIESSSALGCNKGAGLGPGPRWTQSTAPFPRFSLQSGSTGSNFFVEMPQFSVDKIRVIPCRAEQKIHNSGEHHWSVPQLLLVNTPIGS